MSARIRLLWERLRASYWFVPSAMAVATVILSVGALHLDRHFLYEALQAQGWIYTGGAEGARAVLATIAGSVITVAGTTFSITIAALSLASAQFGPRLLRSFMRDMGNQVVLGAFTSTFLYCLLVLRTVRGLDDDVYVPHISVTVGVLLAVLSLGVLIYFIHHVAESIQVANLIHLVAAELNAAVMRLFPEDIGQPAEEPFVGEPEITFPVCATRDGYVEMVDDSLMLDAARDAGGFIVVLVRPGDYVTAGRPVAMAGAAVSVHHADRIRAAIGTGHVRTPSQDAEFAFLQLAEIAVRALSPGVNDPFTAIMCLDRITSAMIRLAGRSLPASLRYHPDGSARIVTRTYTYAEITTAAYGHIRENAANHTQVRQHLRSGIRSVLESTANPAFRAALEAELRELH